MLLDDETAYHAAAALRAIPHRARPFVEEVIADPKFRDCDHWLTHLAQPVFHVLLEILDLAGSDLPLKEAAGMVHSPNAHRRQIAAAFLPRSGETRSLESIAKLLVDPDPVTSDRTFEGLIEAAEARQLAPEVGVRLYGTLRTMALRRDRGPHADASRLMLLIDRDRAAADLTSVDALSPETNWLTWNLRALDRAGIPVPAETLSGLLETFLARWVDEAKEGERASLDIQTADLIKLLAARRTPPIRERLVSLLDHPAAGVRNAAADALLDAAGLAPFLAAAASFERHGWDGMSSPQRSVYTVESLDGEVRNGGFLQYFSNSYGEQAIPARDGLRAIGADACASMVDRAIAFFGPGGIPQDRDRRNDALAAALDRDESPFEALDDRWYQDPDHLRVRLARYALDHAEHFIKPPGAPDDA